MAPVAPAAGEGEGDAPGLAMPPLAPACTSDPFAAATSAAAAMAAACSRPNSRRGGVGPLISLRMATSTGRISSNVGLQPVSE
jgi:hypothetical protein